jgi:hypothetical protein
MRHFIIATAILLSSSLCASGADPHRITMSNYKEVKRGIGVGYVYVLLGRPDAVTFQSGPYKHLAWWIGDEDNYTKIIYVYLKNDKVTDKQEYGL